MKLSVLNMGFIVIAAIILLLIVFIIINTSGKDREQSYSVPSSFDFESNPTYYTEKFRPQYHLSPERGNMSDPNGMVYFEGEYHQFYQNKGEWGHAISEDLLHWEHQPLAITKDGLGDIWSGSAVVDWEDTSGFFEGKPGLVAIFTHFKNGLQSQSLAYSLDKGRSWTKYEGNPVIPNPNVKDFRDPKVFWHESTRTWVMVVSVDKKVWFYSSPDLKTWQFTSEFGPGHGSHHAVWECPDLFEIPIEGSEDKKWVLTVSIGNNTATKGSKAQYFVGTFDGKKFKNDNSPAEVLWTDFGKDFYAAVSYSDIPQEDGRRIWLGWMSNWRYPFAMPTGVWKGNMTIPRELKLRDIPEVGVRLIQEPVKELERLRGKPQRLKKQTLVPGENPFKGIKGTSFEMELSFTPLSEYPFGIKVRKGSEHETVISYDPKAQELILDRSMSGESSFETGFAEKMSAPLKMKDGKIKLRLFVDDMTVEVFANDGEAVMSTIIFPDPTNTDLELFTSEGKVILNEAVYYPMRSVWRDEDPDANKPLRLTVSPSILHVSVGETVKLSAAVLPLGLKQKVKWQSSDETVVTVTGDSDTTAKVVGVKEGKAEIMVTDEEGHVSFSLNVFVE